MSKCTEHSPGPQGRKDKMMSRKLIAGERQYCSRNNPGLELCVSKNLSPVYWMQGSEQMLTTWVLTLNCSPNISVEQGEVCFLAVEFFFFFKWPFILQPTFKLWKSSMLLLFILYYKRRSTVPPPLSESFSCWRPLLWTDSYPKCRELLVVCLLYLCHWLLCALFPKLLAGSFIHLSSGGTGAMKKHVIEQVWGQNKQ